MLLGFLYAFCAAVIWGVVYVIDQKVLTDLSAIAFLFITSLLSGLLVLPLLLFDGNILKSLSQLGRTNLALTLLVLVLATIANFLIFRSIQLVGAPNATIIEISYPFFVALFSLLLFRFAPSPWFLFGGLLIFAGAAIIIYHS